MKLGQSSGGGLRLARRFKVELGERGIDCRVLLFGSHAKGSALDSSDIDLVVVSQSFEGMALDERIRLLYALWHRVTDKGADMYPLTPSELEEGLRRLTLIREASGYWFDVV